MEYEGDWVCWVNVTLFDDADGCRIGMVVQGVSGDLIQAMSSVVEGRFASKVAEAIALREELRWLDTHLSSRGVALIDA